ncbi:MAG: lysoplasmalogenase family protein [Albidovulum sp.]
MTGWIIIAVAAAFAALYGARYCHAAPSGAKTGVKTLSVALLALAAAAAGAPPLVTLGLALGAAGDFFLSLRGERAFLAGMAAFAAGHLAYAAAFVAAGGGVPGLAVLVPLLALGASTEVWLAPHTGALRWPVRGYVLVILIMAAAAFSLPLGLVTLGAALFVLSDFILALDIFRYGPDRPNHWRARVLWAAYWSGQALILLGMTATLAA